MTSREPMGGSVRWAEFLALEDGDPRELVDGRLVEVDVPSVLHEWIVSRLIFLLHGWAEAKRAGVVLGSGFKVRISETRGVMPDVQFFRFGRPIPREALESGAPDLAVEVVSPTSGRYDRVEKLHWYASIGTPEYWLVDGEQKTLHRFVLEPGGLYRVEESLAGDAVFAPGSFPGLEISLAQLWTLPTGP